MVSVVVIVSPNDGDAPDSVPRRIFDAVPDVEIEVESIVPLGESAIPYFWVWGDGLDEFEAVLDGYAEVSDVTALERVDGGALYRIEWDVDSPVLQCIQRAGGAVMDAHGNVDRWRLTVWFERGGGSSSFLDCCNGLDAEVEIARIHSLDRDAGSGLPSVTTAQHEALVVAYENGYFEGPRAITQTDLADRLGISTAAAGRRLRRGTANIVEQHLIR